MKLGALYIGKNIPEIKNKGSIDAFTIAGAASMLGISDVKAIARVEKVADPRIIMMINKWMLLSGK
jgi:hypothetical protein